MSTLYPSNLYLRNQKLIPNSTVNISTLSPTLFFFGDNICLGTNPNGGTLTTQRWSKLCCTTLNKTENNQSVATSEWQESMNSLFDHFTPGSGSVFLAFGANDIGNGQTQLQCLKRVINNAVLFASLPNQCIVNARSTSVVQNGSWSTSSPYTAWGLSSNRPIPTNPNPSLTFTLTGRYICYSVVVLIPNTSTANYIYFSVTINGVAQEPNRMYNNLNSTALGQVYTSFATIIDTLIESSTPKTVVITPSSGGSYDQPAWIDYAAGFNTADLANCKGTVIVEPTIFDYGFRASTLNEPSMIAFNQMLQDRVRFFKRMGFPIIYIKDVLTDDSGPFYFDKIHPTPVGHQMITNRIIQELTQPTHYL